MERPRRGVAFGGVIVVVETFTSGRYLASNDERVARAARG